MKNHLRQAGARLHRLLNDPALVRFTEPPLMPLACRRHDRLSAAGSHMLSQQHHGLRTFHTFQQKLATLSGDEPEQRALCRLLSSLVGGYIEAFDEKPLPVAVADRAFQRLLDLVASLDFRAGADHRLADLNRVAACDLWH